MNSEDNYIISAEQYEKYDDKHENRRWKELLEEKIANGEITKSMPVVAPCDVFEPKVLICTNQIRSGAQCAIRSVLSTAQNLTH